MSSNFSFGSMVKSVGSWVESIVSKKRKPVINSIPYTTSRDLNMGENDENDDNKNEVPLKKKRDSPSIGSPTGSLSTESLPTKSYDENSSPEITKFIPEITQFVPENFSIFNKNHEFILGINHNSDNHYLADLEMIDILTRKERSSMFLQDVHKKMFRNFAFLISKNSSNPLQFSITILDGNPDYNNFFGKLTPEEKDKVKRYQQKIIENMLIQQFKMGIKLENNSIGFSNVPRKPRGGIESYHKDNIVTTLVNTGLQYKLDKIMKDSRTANFAFFYYTSDCISTTIKVFYNGKWIILRFRACPTTELVIDNTKGPHSQPYIMSDRSNSHFNDIILQSSEQERTLNRILIKFLSIEQYGSIIELINPESSESTFSFNIPSDNYLLPKRSISEHLQLEQFKGGKKTKRKITKRKITKRKITKKNKKRK
jgi:hypothetical protein